MPDEDVFDRATYGRLVRAARIIAGFDRLEDLPAVILERTGVEISTRTLYSIERGEQTVTVPQYFALAVALDPPAGLAYWESAMGEGVRAIIRRRIEESR
jgi:hypothetical protein